MIYFLFYSQQSEIRIKTGPGSDSYFEGPGSDLLIKLGQLLGDIRIKPGPASTITPHLDISSRNPTPILGQIHQ